jgi:hypothetical protein
MIRASVLAVPRRTPMLAAKATVFGATALMAGEVIGFASFAIATAILGGQVPMSLADPGILRAVIGVGPYLAVLALIGLAERVRAVDGRWRSAARRVALGW